MSYQDDSLCIACQKGKQVKSYFKAKNIVSTSRHLKLLDLDLFGPIKIVSLSRHKYGLIIVDDYTIWIWVRFLTHKDESLIPFINSIKRFQENDISISLIRSDHGGEFENNLFEKFYEENGIHHNFSTPRIP